MPVRRAASRVNNFARDRPIVAGLDNKTAADVFNKPRRRECALRLWRESSCEGHLAYHYHASWKALLWDCYGQVLGPRCCLSKLADCLCRHPNAWVRLHPHLIWQAAESYLEGGNAFGPVFHLGFFTRLYLTAD